MLRVVFGQKRIELLLQGFNGGCAFVSSGVRDVTVGLKLIERGLQLVAFLGELLLLGVALRLKHIELLLERFDGDCAFVGSGLRNVTVSLQSIECGLQFLAFLDELLLLCVTFRLKRIELLLQGFDGDGAFVGGSVCGVAVGLQLLERGL